MDESISKARLDELELLYKQARDRYPMGASMWNFNDGRATAIRELRIELFGSEPGRNRWRERSDR
jgi:hypothetical protein